MVPVLVGSVGIPDPGRPWASRFPGYAAEEGCRVRPPKKLTISSDEWITIRAAVYAERIVIP